MIPAAHVPAAHIARCHTHRCWSRCIASWETRGIPWPRKASVNTGNGYGGGLQFSLSTALKAGFKPKPSRNHATLATVTTTTLDEQMVRAVRWRNKAGASQWSTSRHCG